MADKRITDLNLIQFSAITSNDVLPIVDINTDETNKITIDQIKTYVNSGITDTYITGGTYVTGGTIVFDYSTGGGFQLTGLTEDLNNEIAGLAEADEQTITLNLDTNKIELKETVASATGGTRTFQGNFAISGGTLNLDTIGSGSPVINLGLDSSGFVVTGTTSIPFTGNTSGDCISDIYVSNIHSCSPLYINPNDEGNIYFGSISGVTVDLTNNKLIVENLQITSGATEGYVLTSDASGNIGLTAPTDGFTYQIGQYVEEEGGVIFHRYKDGSNENYLVVAIQDNSSGVVWDSRSMFTPSIPNTSNLWDGLENTQAIVVGGVPTPNAALSAQSLNIPSSPLQDWYLPAIDELSILWQNRFNVNRTLSGNSSFGSISGATQIGYNNYWSSTQNNATTAWAVIFVPGSLNYGFYSTGKSGSYYVRAVRKFSI